MAYSRFENDVFVSYSHLDDQSLEPGGTGWVSRFAHDLETRLGLLLGQQPTVFRDRKLIGEDFDPGKLDYVIKNSAVLVAVLTPRYVHSDWCQREFQYFLKSAGLSGGVFLEHTARYFKVLTTPLGPADLSPEMQAVVGFEFFELEENGAFRQLDPRDGGESEYREALEQLANDIVDVLSRLRKKEEKPESVSKPAEVDFDGSDDELGGASYHATDGGAAGTAAAGKQVFFSYAREDENFAVDLASKLKAAGVPLWVDQWELSKGDDWDITIEDALYDLPGFMIVLSPVSVRRREVRGELRVALDENKHLFPVVYQKCRWPRQLLLYQCTDLTTDGAKREAEMQRLISDIKAKLQVQ